MSKSDCGRRASEGWEKGWDEAYERVFGVPCDVCGEKGYFEDFDPIQKKYIRTTCLICQGTKRRKI